MGRDKITVDRVSISPSRRRILMLSKGSCPKNTTSVSLALDVTPGPSSGMRETTKYGKIWYDENVHDLKSVETEFPAIVFNDTLTSEATLSCEPTVSSLNDNEIDFRISFDEFDDEDYTPEVSYSNDLKFFKDFENEFPAIVYNDALTSKSDFLTEHIVSPQHIDEFNNETSLSECDEKEQNFIL
ncbi:hypothetical protein Tco_1145940 [Tanacetum coccineum]